MKNMYVVFFALLTLGLTACGGSEYGVEQIPPASLSEISEAKAIPEKAHAYQIGSGDKISVTVYGEKDLTDTYTVNNTGLLSFPLIGQVNVEGLTIKELEQSLKKKLSNGYIKNPSVNVEISEYRPFYILGEVRNPGSYSYVGDMNIFSAVALAGGYTYRADKDSIEILRKNGTESKLLRGMTGNALVTPGDIILVKERFF